MSGLLVPAGAHVALAGSSYDHAHKGLFRRPARRHEWQTPLAWVRFDHEWVSDTVVRVWNSEPVSWGRVGVEGTATAAMLYPDERGRERKLWARVILYRGVVVELGEELALEPQGIMGEGEVRRVRSAS